MIGLLKDRMEDVYRIVLVANTPAYLYDNLREVLAGMAKEVPLPELVSELRKEMESSPNEEYHQSSYIYALFILMTYDRYDDVRHHLRWIGSGKTKWMSYLTGYYKNNAVSLTSMSYTITGDGQDETKVENATKVVIESS